MTASTGAMVRGRPGAGLAETAIDRLRRGHRATVLLDLRHAWDGDRDPEYRRWTGQGEPAGDKSERGCLRLGRHRRRWRKHTLADACVDTVTCNAVIEHVRNPDQVVAEMYRVLKPGGYAQLMVPFVFPYHAYPADYGVTGRSGVLELTRALEPVELSVLTGPTSTMLVLLREYLRIVIPGETGHCRACC